MNIRNPKFYSSTKSIHTCVDNIDGDLDSKLIEIQNSMEEEDLKNNIILDSGSPIDIFSNTKLV